jgi:ubiquitin C-terminal hydrolase
MTEIITDPIVIDASIDSSKSDINITNSTSDNVQEVEIQIVDDIIEIPDSEEEMEVEITTKPVLDFALRPGLINNGNECFINSTMQCLAVSPFINSFIKKYEKNDINIIKLINKYELNKLRFNEMASAIKKLLDTHNIPPVEKVLLEHIAAKCADIYIYICFKQIMQNLYSRKEATSTCTNFMNITRDVSQGSGFDHLFNGSQNDPHEFLVYLLDRLHSAKASKVTMEIPSSYEPDKIHLRLYLEHFKKRYENDFSMFVKIFYYYMLTCIECHNCKHVTYDVSPNDVMCVNLPDEWQHKPLITLDDCIADYFKVEGIDYRCEKCQNTIGNRQDRKILTRPRTVIIKLKRYTQMNGGLHKILKFIQYPKILNLDKYQCSSDSKPYELYGVINHVGFMNGGHYYSFIRDYNPDTEKFSRGWMVCNDTQVSNISEEEALHSKNAYILFYHNIE